MASRLRADRAGHGRAGQITAAQRARGLDTEGIWRRVRGIVPIVGPVILASIAEVEERTMALEARGFTRPGRRTLLWAPPDSGLEALRALDAGARPRRSSPRASAAGSRTIALTRVGYRYAGAVAPALLDVDLEPAGRRGRRPGWRLGIRQDHAVPGRQRPGANAMVGGQIRGHITLDGADVDHRPMHARGAIDRVPEPARDAMLSQVTDTVFEEVAFGPMNLSPWPATRWSSGRGRHSRPADRRVRRA